MIGNKAMQSLEAGKTYSMRLVFEDRKSYEREFEAKMVRGKLIIVNHAAGDDFIADFTTRMLLEADNRLSVVSPSAGSDRCGESFYATESWLTSSRAFPYGDGTEEHATMMDQMTLLPRNGIATVIAGFFARLLFVLPVCWLVYTLGFAVCRCYSFAKGAKECFELVLVMPIAFTLPSIVHDEDPPLSIPYLSILLVAAGISAVWTTILLISTRRRTRNGRR
jgi:hypothetical protein